MMGCLNQPADTAEAITGEGWLRSARERLAHYKCPSTVDVVDALPRNPSGKILKRTLRARTGRGATGRSD
jgi:acyl-CoA synthetase (AMP-forming)/AMP-acid ligase II